MLRGFTDSNGVEWRVWDVQPSSAVSASAAAALSRSSLSETPFAQGWLCFESAGEKRRLAPIPAEWEHEDVGDLEEWCSAATPVRGRARDDRNGDGEGDPAAD